MPSRDNGSFLKDILQSSEAIQDFLTGLTFDEYRADLKTRSAVERQLQILTEAVFRLGDQVETISGVVDWRSLRGLGNFIRHQYDYIDDQIIWNIIHQQFPGLIAEVQTQLGIRPRAIKPAGDPVRLGILLSGRGSNFQAIHQAIASGSLPGAEIAVVLSNKADAPGLITARALGLAAHHIPVAGRTPAERDAEFIQRLRDAKVDLVCLAGYMRIISPAFVQAFSQQILNVHPSLLPSFPGLEAQTQALEFGAKVAGCTVHFVDEQVDHGVIILQRMVAIEDDDTPETLSARILAEEHKAYPEALRRVLSGAYKVVGRRYIRR